MDWHLGLELGCAGGGWPRCWTRHAAVEARRGCSQGSKSHSDTRLADGGARQTYEARMLLRCRSHPWSAVACACNTKRVGPGPMHYTCPPARRGSHCHRLQAMGDTAAVHSAHLQPSAAVACRRREPPRAALTIRASTENRGRLSSHAHDARDTTTAGHGTAGGMRAAVAASCHLSGHTGHRACAELIAQRAGAFQRMPVPFAAPRRIRQLRVSCCCV